MTKTVLVCEAQVPFVHGGAELLVRGLLAELTRRGYRAEKVSIPKVTWLRHQYRAIYDSAMADRGWHGAQS